MKKLSLAVLMLAAVTGCCSYSEFKRNCGQTTVDGSTVLATYEVVNVSYRLFGCLPITVGSTWKTGPYDADVGSVDFFGGECSLDDNLASVRHACDQVGGGRIADVVGRDDVFNAWSLFLVRKEVIKTSCVILGK